MNMIITISEFLHEIPKTKIKKAFQLLVIQKINPNKQHTLVISSSTEPVSKQGP